MRVIALDPGVTMCGLVEFTDGDITHVSNNTFHESIKFILATAAVCDDTTVVYEDLQIYRGLKLGKHIIQVGKFLGEMEYRFKVAAVEFHPVFRWQIKKYVYENFYHIVVPRIEAKIKKNNLMNKDGDPMQPKFVFVDDRCVIAAMRECWDIPRPKPGKKNKYGITQHAWQALAIMTYFVNTPRDTDREKQGDLTTSNS